MRDTAVLRSVVTGYKLSTLGSNNIETQKHFSPIFFIYFYDISGIRWTLKWHVYFTIWMSMWIYNFVAVSWKKCPYPCGAFNTDCINPHSSTWENVTMICSEGDTHGHQKIPLWLDNCYLPHSTMWTLNRDVSSRSWHGHQVINWLAMDQSKERQMIGHHNETLYVSWNSEIESTKLHMWPSNAIFPNGRDSMYMDPMMDFVL